MIFANDAFDNYTNPYGVRLGPCNLCGFCERFGCFLYSKASPQTTILPILADRRTLEVRTNAYVTRILRDSGGKIATGVLYTDESGNEIEQPADLVILSAFQMHNVRLLLLSGIGTPYDPATGKGVVGKNYAYQMCSITAARFSENVEINPFIGAGAAGQRAIDFNGDHYDHSQVGFPDSELAQFLRKGANPDGIAFGSMSDVIVHRTQYLTDEDALAAAKYLKTIHSPSDMPTAPFTYDKASTRPCGTATPASRER